jgi:hypothetical protein
MPNRILREGILTSSAVTRLGWAEEVFYRRLHSVVDDFGRYYADEGMLRAACYPRQLNKVSDSDIGKWLRACVDAALVRVYPAQDGERYLEVVKFGQQVRAKKSKFPDMLSVCVADAHHVPANAHLDVSVSEVVSVKTSEAKASDAGAAGDEVESAKAALWRESVVVLKAGGCPESLCRSFMGKLVKDYTEATVREAVTAAISAQPADAREYLKATCQRLKGERKDPVTVPSTDKGAEQFKAAMDERAAVAVKPPAHLLALAGRAVKAA